MNIVLFRDEGGYNLYGVEVTKYLKNTFPELKSAFVCFYADGKKEAKAIGNGYINENEERKMQKDEELRNIFTFDGDSILLEFKNGKKVTIHSSEWGSIDWE